MTGPGMAVLVGDIQLTARTAQGEEYHSPDCGLSKIRMIDHESPEGRTLLGFAGEVEAAMALMNSLGTFRRERSSPYEDLGPFLRRWSPEAWTELLRERMSGLEDPDDWPGALLVHLRKEPISWAGRKTFRTEGASVTMTRDQWGDTVH